MSFAYRGPDGLLHIQRPKKQTLDDEIIYVERRIDPYSDNTEYMIQYENGHKTIVKGKELTDDQLRQIAGMKENQRFVFNDFTIGEIRPSRKPKRLRCLYCGRIALEERPTCEGCGAVLPWEIDYEA